MADKLICVLRVRGSKNKWAIATPEYDCYVTHLHSLRTNAHASRFRYEEAIPPDTLMYFSWGTTSQANGSAQQSSADFKALLAENQILQIGGQESLGRGFVQQCLAAH